MQNELNGIKVEFELIQLMFFQKWIIAYGTHVGRHLDVKMSTYAYFPSCEGNR
jgi:hypothetical protein